MNKNKALKIIKQLRSISIKNWVPIECYVEVRKIDFEIKWFNRSSKRFYCKEYKDGSYLWFEQK